MDSGAYGVQVGNKFELFLDDASDPEELEQRALELSKIAQEKKKKEELKKKAAPPVKKEAAPKAGVPAAAQKGPSAAATNNFPQTRKEGFEEGKENKPERGGFRGGFRGGRGEGRGGFRGDRGGRGRGAGGERGGGPKANYTNFPEGEVPPRFAQQQKELQPEGGDQQPKKFEDRFGESRGGGFGRGRGGRGGFRGEYRGRGRGGPRPPGQQDGGGNFGEWNGPPAGGEEGQQGGGGKGFGQLIEDGAPPAKGGFGTFSVTNADDEGADVTGFKEGRGGRGFGRGRGVRGGRGGGGFGRGRQFERHSGSDRTGVKPVEKREGGGSYNWGDTKDELKGETEPLDTTTGSDEQGGGGGGEKPADGGEGKEDGAPAQAVEPEPIVMTLDEWKKQQEPRERPQFNIRRAGEGEDDKQWKKLVPLQKEIKASDGDDEHEDEEHEDRRKHKTVDLSINFFDEAKRVGGIGSEGRGGFGRGRGRGEGRGGYGEGRGGYGEGRGGDRPPRGERGGFRGGRGEGRGGGGFRGGGGGGDRGGFSGGGGHRGGGGGGGRGRGHAEEFSLAGESFPELSSAA